MDAKTIIITSGWIAIALIAVTYIYIGGVTLVTSIVVGLLVMAAFGLTFGLAFGLEDTKMRSMEVKARMDMSEELTEIKTAVSALSEKVDCIKKELEV